MWTSKLIQVNNEDQRTTAVVLFTDNTKYKLLETFDLQGLTSSDFRNRVESKRKTFEDSYSFVDTINVETFDLSPDAKEEPTPEQEKELAYVRERMMLESAKRDLDLKLITQEEYDAILQKVKDIKPIKAAEAEVVVK